ncbi:hypothetical protein amb0862 [Paramagnetospirillum magneticum AMB-1]|uniref:Uncharacterized protein n=1 Tax=Paramagnetospirillum magneticum (strain ATCC 700264 / AMB-1) TaxID=342108 RepID=Q2W909_PARM1|nr:hypothetical protein amb0862 [Paramagnetospirillum magneticum AMB-1]
MGSWGSTAMEAPGWTKRSPESGRISPARTLSSVDLPEPLRPTRQVLSPLATQVVTPSKSGVPPKVRRTSRSARRGGGAMPDGYTHGARLSNRVHADFAPPTGLRPGRPRVVIALADQGADQFGVVDQKIVHQLEIGAEKGRKTLEPAGNLPGQDGLRLLDQASVAAAMLVHMGAEAVPRQLAQQLLLIEAMGDQQAEKITAQRQNILDADGSFRLCFDLCGELEKALVFAVYSFVTQGEMLGPDQCAHGTPPRWSTLSPGWGLLMVNSTMPPRPKSAHALNHSVTISFVRVVFAGDPMRAMG